MAQEGIQSEKIKMIDSWKDSIEANPPKEEGRLQLAAFVVFSFYILSYPLG